jgi:serine protease Do
MTPRRPGNTRPLAPLVRVMAVLVVLTTLAALSPARAGTMLEDAMARVLVVRSDDAADRFLGSAFLWGTGEVAVTNAHVTGGADTVRLVDQTGRAQTARVIGQDAVRDVAVLAVTPGLTGLQPGPIPALGEPVWALGAPLGLDFTLTRGMVSARARQVEAAVPLRLLQHDAAVNPGSSGGPLIDAQGRVVGMNSRIADGSRHYIGMSFAIAAPDLAVIVQALIDETLLQVPDLGLHLRPVSREIAQALGVSPGGILVDRVEAGSIAERAGLAAGDVIQAAGGRVLAGPGDLAFAVDAALPTGSMGLTLQRAGAAVEALLTFEAPESAFALREIDSAAPARVASYRLADLGITIDDTARVTGVTENSPALFAGLARGDRILRLNGQALDAAALRGLDIAEPALLLIARNGGATLHLMLDPWDTGTGLRPVGGANVLDPDVVVF